MQHERRIKTKPRQLERAKDFWLEVGREGEVFISYLINQCPEFITLLRWAFGSLRSLLKVWTTENKLCQKGGWNERVIKVSSSSNLSVILLKYHQNCFS